MGDPCERSELERSNTRTLATLIVDAVINDEDPPVERMSPEAVKETVWAFAQEIVQLNAELDAARALTNALEEAIRSTK